MEYWALINNFKVGPLEPDKLAPYGITPDTLVWCEGMPQWTPARYVPDMQPLLSTPPPPVFAPGQSAQAWGYTQRPAEPCPPTYLVWSVIATVVCCMIPGIVAIIYGIQVDSNYNTGNIQGARDASSKARTWMLVSVAIGLLGSFLYIICAIAGAIIG